MNRYLVLIVYFVSALVSSLLISRIRKVSFWEIFINKYTLISYSVALITFIILNIIF